MFAMEYASIIFLKTTGRSRIPSSKSQKMQLRFCMCVSNFILYFSDKL